MISETSGSRRNGTNGARKNSSDASKEACIPAPTCTAGGGTASSESFGLMRVCGFVGMRLIIESGLFVRSGTRDEDHVALRNAAIGVQGIGVENDLVPR